MARRSRQGAMSLLMRAPWWVGLTAGAGIWAFCAFAFQHIHLPGSATNSYIAAIDAGLRTSAIEPIKWVLIFLCLFAAGASAMNARSRAALLDRQRDLFSLKAMSWQEFEQVVGESFKRFGYTVNETGQGGADGGVDLVLRKRGQKIIVQCKQWKSNSIGAPVVREMYGLMAHHKADSVFIVCVSKFTKDALAFAQGKPIQLIDGENLLRLVKEVQKSLPVPDYPACPTCGGSTLPKDSVHKGRLFFGCNHFPKCRGFVLGDEKQFGKRVC